mgnify:CR=1 FL=1
MLPVAACNKLKRSDLKDASLSGDNKSMLRSGLIGMIDRFMIYQTNCLYTTTDTVTVTYIMAGHKSAITFADQITNIEHYKPEKSFSEAIKGLWVYGYKVVKPDCLAMLYAAA